MDFLELAQARFSVLEYEKKAVEPEKIEKILMAGIAAPTACNNQPQRILLINDDERREKLNRVIPSRSYVPVAFLVCYDESESWIRPMDGKNSGEIDAAVSATHMMLEATDLGLGSIWVMYWDPEKMKQAFLLSDSIIPAALLIVGYRAKTAVPRKGHLERKQIGEILLQAVDPENDASEEARKEAGANSCGSA